LPSEKQLQQFQDILENIARIERFTAGLDADSLARNEQAFYAVLHALLIISEAARRLGSEAEALVPDQTWQASAASETCCVMLTMASTRA